MPAIVMDLFVLVGVMYCGFLGLSRGFYEAAVAGLEVLGALVLAILAHEFVAGLVGQFVSDFLGPFLPSSLSIQAWSVFLVFALVFWGTLAALVHFVHPLLRADDVLPATLVDRLGGAAAGAYAGSLLVGAILVTWSMCPLLSGLLPVPARRMNLDAGRFALRSAGRFATEWRTENPAGVLDGEPVSPQKTRTACTESWRDLNENGTCEESDQYHDADNNQQFTRVLYYVDQDGDGARRIGLVDKYVVGVWDINLRSDRVEEQAPKKPPALPPRNERRPPPTGNPVEPKSASPEGGEPKEKRPADGKQPKPPQEPPPKTDEPPADDF
ncbi:MAG: hypothetical protein ACK6CT_10410 [Planctomycetia bacterium]|jgi:hypothetical protein